MSRLALIACLPLLLLLAACGGDGDDNGDDGDNSSDQGQDGATVTPTPKLVASPPPAGDDDPLLTYGTAESPYTPTLAQFQELPHTTIDAGGEKEGVSLAELASQAGAPEGTMVTIQGTRRDGRRIQFVRESLSEIGAQSVLVVEDGRLSLYSSVLGEDQWLTNVLVVSFP
ncbi:MAG: hypothetical protein WD557_05870 [Dehalococcoidia bacterium]